MITVSAYLPEGRPTPGRVAQVPLELVSRGPAELVTAEVTVRDERGVDLLDPADTGDILVDPCAGGGPLGDIDSDRRARIFGLTNTAYNAQRALRRAAELLGHPLPHLLIRVGLHESPRRWGGGHYRVKARTYDPPETGHALASGEIHLGGGGSYIPAPGGVPYFNAPSHNLAIIYHETGHHVCRHTADFRLNRLRPADEQTNKKIALDEGSCDYFTAILLDSPDIYGWHRSSVPEWDRRRRSLHAGWSMASFQGGMSDPHADGTVWGSACWTARQRVIEAGYDRERFDRMVLRGLELSYSLAQRDEPGMSKQALKLRRYVSRLLEAMLRADPELSGPVLAGMAEHGIRPGESNVTLRDADFAARRDALMASS